jgi:hypothetical protein
VFLQTFFTIWCSKCECECVFKKSAWVGLNKINTVWNNLQYTTKLKKFLNNYITLNRLEVSNLLEYDTILIGKHLPTRPIGNHLLVNMMSYPRRQIVNTTVRTSHLALKDILKHYYYYQHTTKIFGIFIVSIKRNMMTRHTSTMNSC